MLKKRVLPLLWLCLLTAIGCSNEDGGTDTSQSIEKIVDCAGKLGGDASLDLCGVCQGDNSTCDCSDEPYCMGMVASHNDIRQRINSGTYYNQPQPVTALNSVTWDQDLAQVANQWASGCDWNHNSARTADYAALGGSGYVGENIAASTNQRTPAEIVDDQWGQEALAYDYTNNSCSGTCGHYTQVAWSTSTRIGCATVFCSSISGINWDSGWLTVCNYAPGGNINGQRPY